MSDVLQIFKSHADGIKLFISSRPHNAKDCVEAKAGLLEYNEALDAVAEYIAANDEYDLMLAVKAEAVRHGAELYKMAAIDKDIQKATERRALAHAKMKGR